MMYEMCDCGHLGGNGNGVHRGQEHWLGRGKWKSYDTYKLGPQPDLVTPGHGPCTECDCKQFTWIYFCDKKGTKLTDEQVKEEVIQ